MSGGLDESMAGLSFPRYPPEYIFCPGEPIQSVDIEQKGRVDV